ncbi:MAG: FHA domain-containing protein [Planctomycetes bacterium]|nr:FHA domain-containing protein [Planctomycetota bacterium]MBL7039180.1 FHA domain-containing protein [Pirellulaceae bacterium]
MNIKLLSIEADAPDFEITLDELPVRVGRHQDVKIQIQDRWISRLHCEIDHIEGTLNVRDLGSRHGVFVNGFHVVQAHLMPDDRLTIGMTSFRVHYEREAAALASR